MLKGSCDHCYFLHVIRAWSEGYLIDSIFGNCKRCIIINNWKYIDIEHTIECFLLLKLDQISRQVLFDSFEKIWEEQPVIQIVKRNYVKRRSSIWFRESEKEIICYSNSKTEKRTKVPRANFYSSSEECRRKLCQT